MPYDIKSSVASFGGTLLKLAHQSITTNCEMAFNLYLPPQASNGQQKVPVLFYLSGLTCTPNNCSEKGFLHHNASKKGIAIVYPDTSPRGWSFEGEHDDYDFGSGAGFYVDATKAPYDHAYNMYSYVTEELPGLLFREMHDKLDATKIGLTGHSMGGHGALTMFLKNPHKYKSVSAFAPICNPINSPWGQKAFKGYFGDEQQKWKEHDATELIKAWNGPAPSILIDVGTADGPYKQGQLLPENLLAAAQESGVEKKINVRFQPGYDHSYYMVSSFADDHIEHAAKYLCA